MSDETIIREALIWNQPEAMRAIMERDDRIRELEAERDALNHTVKCYQAEISARAASAKQLRELLVDLEIDLQAARYGRPNRMGMDRIDEDGERTFAPNLEEDE